MAGEQDTPEAKAKAMGWVEKENFRGDPEKWVDAGAFLERGEQIMPILRKNNERLQGEVNALRGQVAETRQLFSASQEAIEELKKFHNTDTERRVEKAKKDLLAAIKTAKREGDTDLEVDLQQELNELSDAAKDAKDGKKPEPPLRSPPQPVVDPAFIQWKQENPWFETDVAKTALTVAFASQIRADPANNTLVGKAFYERAAQEADAKLNPATRRPPSKLEEGGGGGGGGSAPKGRVYADLPQEARDVCERQTPKLVGEGRAFKTKKEWQEHYVQQYFLGE